MWRLIGKVAVLAGGVAVAMPDRGFTASGAEERMTIGELLQENASFYGLFSAHGGPHIARFLQDRLYDDFMVRYELSKGSSVQRVQQSLLLTFDSLEQEIKEAARKPLSFGFSKPVYVGSTALVAVVSDTFYVAANLGDAQALLFSTAPDGQLQSKSLCPVHSLSNLKEKQRLRKEHPQDLDLISNKKIKGRVKVTRAFGHLDLKDKEFDNPQGLNSSFGFIRAKSPYTGPYLTHTPDIVVGEIGPQDKFIVLGSSTFWEVVNLAEVSQILVASSNPQEASEKLLSLAQSSAHPNKDELSLSVVVAQFYPTS